MLHARRSRTKGRACARLRQGPARPPPGDAPLAGWGRRKAWPPEQMKAAAMAKPNPAPTTSRPINPDEHALNAIYLTKELFNSGVFAEFEEDYRRLLGGELGLYELIQNMARAVSELECCYDSPPWNDQLEVDWESACTLFVEAVLTHINETREAPNVHVMLARVLFPTKRN